MRHIYQSIAQKNMVDGLLRPCGIVDDRLLEAFLELDRRCFAPKHSVERVYSDAAIQLTSDRPMLPMWVLGQLIQAIELKAHHKVLVVGCSTGYTCRLLEIMGCFVVGLESDGVLLEKAYGLRDTKCERYVLVKANLRDGFIDLAPYDSIIFDGALGVIPKAYWGQMKKDGKIACVYKPHSFKMGEICVFTRHRENNAQKNKNSFWGFEKKVYGQTNQPFLGEFQSYQAFRFC